MGGEGERVSETYTCRIMATHKKTEHSFFSFFFFNLEASNVAPKTAHPGVGGVTHNRRDKTNGLNPENGSSSVEGTLRENNLLQKGKLRKRREGDWWLGWGKTLFFNH
eukprot:TRINITY_DN3241_c0_g1_i1.p2 TRINITY_DN3241_c0_g1~~TRINITY_DN3241_c0_g1_i1.p2  ORF type:complete len:108 (-),score=3.05 TRINITY_DN3241_c0_g1_i1:665-988(-)